MYTNSLEVFIVQSSGNGLKGSLNIEWNRYAKYLSYIFKYSKYLKEVQLMFFFPHSYSLRVIQKIYFFDYSIELPRYCLLLPW